MYCIYRITNKINGNTYIGQHKYKDLSSDSYMGSGKYLWNAKLKYGIDNFEREIIVSEIESFDEINRLEKYYIKLERESGHGEYNISDGGNNPVLSGENSPVYNKIWIHNDEIEYYVDKDIPIPDGFSLGRLNSGEYHSCYNTRWVHNEEGINKHIPKDEPLPEGYYEGVSDQLRLKYSELSMGNNNPFYGKHHTEGTLSKLRSRLKGRPAHNKGIPNTDEAKNKMSIAHKGRINIYKGDTNKVINPNELELYLNEGWSLGKPKLGKKFYNNGVECHKYIPGTEPKGYILGRLM